MKTMGERVDNGAGTSVSAATVFQQVAKDSDGFKNIVTLLQNSYLGSVSRSNFQYSQTNLVINSSFIEEYKKFIQQKKASGYTEEELKEGYVFLLFDSENQAKLVCKTGACVGNSAMSTLGNPVAGVYISKYSNYLHPRPWYQGKSGYIVIFKLIKGKVKVVPENYTSKYTAPSPGYDCHVSANIGKVTAKTSHFQAFELNQYYIYEFHNRAIVQRPRQICPYAILAFQYTEPKRTIAILKDKVVIGHKNQVYYRAWKGPLIIKGQLVCDVILQSLHTSAIPAQLSSKLEVKDIMHVSALKKQLPAGVFEKSNFIKKEAHHQGIYCSLYEVITSNQKEDKLKQLIDKMKEKDLAIVRSLNDQGFLLLITSSVLTSGKEFDVRIPAGLLALFLFTSSRLLSLQGRRSSITAEQKRNKETNLEAISLMVTSVLPGLQYALLETKKFQCEVEMSPRKLVEKYFQDFVQFHRTGSPPDVCDGRILINLSSDLSADELAPSENCRKMALPRLRTYFADPSSFAVEASQMTEALQSSAKKPPYSCLITNGSCKAVAPVTPVGSAPAGRVRTEAEKAEAPSGKSQPSQGGRSKSVKETREELSPRREKRKCSPEVLTGAKRRWTSQTLLSAVESIATSKGTRTTKNPFSLFSKKPAQGAAQNTSETTVKLANIQYPQRRKRGAEVLTAEFVQHTKPEISTSGATSLKDRSSGLCIKKPKETQKPSSQKMITRTMKKNTAKGKAKVEKQLTVRKQVEPARQAAFGSPRNNILSESRAASVDVNKTTKQSSTAAAERGSKQSKRSTSSYSKSISTLAQSSSTKSVFHKKGLPFRNSDMQNKSSVTLAQDSSGKNDGTVLDRTSGGSDVQEESSGAPSENYESHALNLLADLALSSVTTSAVPSVVRNDHVLPSISTQYSVSPKEKPVRTFSDHEYHRLDKRDKRDKQHKGSYLGRSPSALHRYLLKRNIALYTLEKRSCAHVTFGHSGPGSHISLEHSYTLPFPDNSKKYHFLKTFGKYSIHNIKADSAVIGTVTPFSQQQQNLNEKPGRSIRDSDQKTGSPQSRTVLKTNETYKVTCTWEADYLFHLDSKYTSDPLEKTVNRALHGPWDLDLPDNMEEVKLLLHTWVALFYNKPNKPLSTASRKVVEHSNPAKYVSINSTLDSCEVLEEDDRSSGCTHTHANSPSKATDNFSNSNNYTLPLSCSPLFCSKSPTRDGMQTDETEDSIAMFLKNRKGKHTLSSDACSNNISDCPDKVNGHEIEQEASLRVEESCKSVSSSNECAGGNSTPLVLPSNESGSVPKTAGLSQTLDFHKTSQPELSEDVDIEEIVIDDIISISENKSTTNEVTVSLKDNKEGHRSGGDRERLPDSEKHQTEDESLHQKQIASNESKVCKEAGGNLGDKNLALEHISDVHTQEVLEQTKLDANKSLCLNELSRTELPSARHSNQEASHKVLQSLTKLKEQSKLKSVQIDATHHKCTETSVEDARHSSIDQINEPNQVHKKAAAQEHRGSVTAVTNECPTGSEPDTMSIDQINEPNQVHKKATAQEHRGSVTAVTNECPTGSEPDTMCSTSTNIAVSDESTPHSEGLNTTEKMPVCANEVKDTRAEKGESVNTSLHKFAESPDVPPVCYREEALKRDDFTQINFQGSRLDCTPMENEEVGSEKDKSLCVSDPNPQKSEGEQKRCSFSDVSELQFISIEKHENDSLKNKTRTSDQKDEMDGTQTNMDSDKKETSSVVITSHSDDNMHNESDTKDQEHEISLVKITELLKNDAKNVSTLSNQFINCGKAEFRNSICISEGEESKHVCDEIAVSTRMKMKHKNLAGESPIIMEDSVHINSKYTCEEEGKTKQMSCANDTYEAMEAQTSKTTGDEFTCNIGGVHLLNSECAPEDVLQESSVCKTSDLQSDQLLTEEPAINLGNVSPVSSVCASEDEQNAEVCHERSVCKLAELPSDQLIDEEPTFILGGFSPVSSECASEDEQKAVEECHENSVCKTAELQSDQLFTEEPAINLGNVSPVSFMCASEGEQKTVELCHESYVCKTAELQRDQLLTEEHAINLGNVSPVSSVCTSEGEQKTVEVCHESSVYKTAELQSDQFLTEEPAINLENVSPVCSSEGEQKTVEVCHQSSVHKAAELQSDQLLTEEPEINLGNSPVSSVCASEGEQKTVEVCHESSVRKTAELQSDQLLSEEPVINLGNVSPVSSVFASEGEQKTVKVCHESSVCKTAQLQSDQLLTEEPAINLENVSPVCTSEGERKTVALCHESSVRKTTELQCNQLLKEGHEINLGNVSAVSSVSASEGEQEIVEVCHESSVYKTAELQSDQFLTEEPAINLENVSPVCSSEGEQKTVEVCHQSSVHKAAELQSDQLLTEEPAINLENVSPVCASKGEQKTVEVCHESSVCKIAELQSDQLLAEEPVINLGNVSPVSSVCASEGEQETVEVCHESSVCKTAELQSVQLLTEEPLFNLGNVSPVSSVCASEGEQKTVEVCHESSVPKTAELQSDQLLTENPAINLGNVSPVSSEYASEGEHETVEVCHESSVCTTAELQSDQLLTEEPAINLGNVSPVCASEGEQKTVNVCQESSVCRRAELQNDQFLTEEPAINLGNISPVSSVCTSEGEQKTVEVCHESSVCKTAELQSVQLLTEEPLFNLGNVSPVSSVCASEGEQKTVEVCHESSVPKTAELQSDQLLTENPAINLGNVSPVSSEYASEGEQKTVNVCLESSVCKRAELQSVQLLTEEPAINLGNVSPMNSVCASEGEQKTVEVCHESSVPKTAELQSDQLLTENPAINLGNVSPVSSEYASEGEQKTVNVCHESSVCKRAELQSVQLLTEEPAINLGNVSPVSSVCASEGEQKTVEVSHESSVCKTAGLQSVKLLTEEPEINLGNVSPVSSVCASEGEQKTVEVCHESSVPKTAELQSDQLLTEEPAINLGNVSPVSSEYASEGEQKTVNVCFESSVCKRAELQSVQLLTEEPAINLGNVSSMNSVCASEGEQKTVEVCHESSVPKTAELQSDQLLTENPAINLGNVSPVSSEYASEGEQKTVNVCHESSVCKRAELQIVQLLTEEPAINLGNVSPVSSVCASEGEQKTEVCHESSVCKTAELQSVQLLTEEPAINLGNVSPVSSVCACEGELKAVEVCHESSVCQLAELPSDQLIEEEPTGTLGGFSPVSSVCAFESEQKSGDAHYVRSVSDIAELQSDQLLAEELAINLGGFSPVSSVCAFECDQKTADAHTVYEATELQSDQLLAEEHTISLGGFSPVSSVCVSEVEERPVNSYLKSSVCKVAEFKKCNKEKTGKSAVVACIESPDEGLYSPLAQKSSKSPVYESCEELLEANSNENSFAEHTMNKGLSGEPGTNRFHKQQNSEQEPNAGNAKPYTVNFYDSFVSRIRDTARKSLLRKSTSRYPEYERDWDYTTTNKRFPLDSVSKYRDFHTVSEEENECPPLPNRITNRYGNPKNCITFTIKGLPREPSRPLHSFQEDNSIERPNQISTWDRKWMVTDLTQNTLDLEYLRFIHKLKLVLKSLAPPMSTHANRFLTNSGEATVKTSALPKGPERQISTRANSNRTPLLITIRRSDAAGRTGLCQHPPCKVKGNFAAPPFCVRFQDCVAGGRKASKSRNQTSKLTSSFHTTEFNYENKLREPPAPSRPARQAKMSAAISGGMAKGWSGDIEENLGSSEEIQDSFPPNTTSYKSVITDLCSNLCFKLNSVAKDASKKHFMFFILETSDDPSFRRMKNLLKREGHTEMEVLPFCQAEHLEEDTLVIIIKNEDISSHIHERLDNLLHLRHSLLQNTSQGMTDVMPYG
uniref:Protein TASOR 2 isoform X2 n=1 Tax=Geotrypetes seraphini TaxID=260995 RepID=A0A6P8S7T2_GEOSA|nr:protein TASOR 2 isoform X2 [Geotrypetes seraphini]